MQAVTNVGCLGLLAALEWGCGGLALEDRGGDAGIHGPSDAASSPDHLTSDARSSTDARTDASDAIAADARAIDSGGRTLVALAKRQSAISGLAVDSANVYWSTFWPASGMGPGVVGTVMRAPIEGGAATQLATAPFPVYLALEASTLYWSQNPGAFANAVIVSLPVGGGTPSQLAFDSKTNCNGMAVGPAGVYWAGDEQGIQDVPLAGGAVSTVTQGANLYTGVALDLAAVYWTSFDEVSRNGSVVSAPLSGGASTTLASGAEIIGDRESVAVNATGIYWGQPNGIRGVLKGGTEVTTLSHSGPDEPANMTIDDTDVYWLHAGKVMKAPLRGGRRSPSRRDSARRAQSSSTPRVSTGRPGVKRTRTLVTS